MVYFYRVESLTVENYLKAIFKLSEEEQGKVSTNAIAGQMHTAAATVTDMLKKLAEKKLVIYQKYKGVKLSEKGEVLARQLIRRHRLWEVFLTKHLGFPWDAVHDMAEELEHIDYPDLINRLDDFLGNPLYDPHGDPIPDSSGKIIYHEKLHLNQLKAGETGIIVAVDEHSPEFLQYLAKVQLVLNTEVQVIEYELYDASMRVRLADRGELVISEKVSCNLLVRKLL